MSNKIWILSPEIFLLQCYLYFKFVASLVPSGLYNIYYCVLCNIFMFPFFMRTGAGLHWAQRTQWDWGKLLHTVHTHYMECWAVFCTRVTLRCYYYRYELAMMAHAVVKISSFCFSMYHFLINSNLACVVFFMFVRSISMVCRYDNKCILISLQCLVLFYSFALKFALQKNMTLTKLFFQLGLWIQVKILPGPGLNLIYSLWVYSKKLTIFNLCWASTSWVFTHCATKTLW